MNTLICQTEHIKTDNLQTKVFLIYLGVLSSNYHTSTLNTAFVISVFLEIYPLDIPSL